MILKIDKDFKKHERKAVMRYLRMLIFRLDWFCYYFDIRPVYFEVHKTTKGLHIRGHTDVELGARELIILQLVLGSDWLREVRNLFRVQGGMEDWNLLFNVKYKMQDGKYINAMRESFLMSFVVD